MDYLIIITGSVAVIYLVLKLRKITPMATVFCKELQDAENEAIYLQTKSNYKDNGIYEDNETDD